jgi:hypothetical protein
VKYGLTQAPVELSFGTGKGVMDFDTKFVKEYLEQPKK